MSTSNVGPLAGVKRVLSALMILGAGSVALAANSKTPARSKPAAKPVVKAVAKRTATAAAASAPTAPVVAANFPQGTYRIVGWTCRNPQDLTDFAKARNEEFRTGNRESVLQFHPNFVIARNRSFKFNGYGQDQCATYVKRSVMAQANMMSFMLESRAIDSQGRFEPLDCEKTLPASFDEKFFFALQGDYLYLLPQDAKASPAANQVCNSGPLHIVYRRADRFELTRLFRPERLPREEEILRSLNTNPRSIPDLEKYVVFLFAEDRLNEARVRADAILGVDPNHPFAKTISAGLQRMREERDQSLRRQELARLNLHIQQAFPPQQRAVANDAATSTAPSAAPASAQTAPAAKP